MPRPSRVQPRTNAKAERSREKIVTVNRRAYHDYFIEEEVEAGVQLTGTEIKSIRDGRVNIRDAYARIEHGEAFVYGMHVSPYEQAGQYFQHDPLRPRKLLLHRKQIEHLARQSETRGYTLAPLRLRCAGGAKPEWGWRAASIATTSATR